MVKLGGYYPPLLTTALLGHHRRLSAVRAFLALFVVDSVRRLRRFKSLHRALEKVSVKCQQTLMHHPNLLGNPRRGEVQILSVCLTYQCNRACSFCYARGLRDKFKEHMSLADFEFLAVWAKTQGWSRMRLLGGEPTFHPEFGAIMDIAEKHGVAIYITTNGLFASGLNPSIAKSIVRSICFSYPQDGLAPGEMELFLRNFRHAVTAVNIVNLSWVIQPGNDGWRTVIDLASGDRTRIMVRFSLVMPGHSKSFDQAEFYKWREVLARQVVEIARYAREKNVVFAFYRPLLLCMFEPGQLNFLRSISPFLFYTRCPLCLKGEYDTDLRLTVNPDLSCYPCMALAVDGVRLGPGITRDALIARFKPFMREITSRPLMEACRDCRFFANYKKRLDGKFQDLADRTVCQGGCLQYRA